MPWSRREHDWASARSCGLPETRLGFAKRKGHHMRIWGKLVAAALALAALGSTATAQTVKIGSKNFTEQFVVAELYAAALEAAGFKVERKINLGATLVAHEALRTGAIDLYPEYTGTGLQE